MKQNLPLLFLFLSISIFSQNIISGKVVNEINLGIPSVLVVNINTDQNRTLILMEIFQSQQKLKMKSSFQNLN